MSAGFAVGFLIGDSKSCIALPLISQDTPKANRATLSSQKTGCIIGPVAGMCKPSTGPAAARTAAARTAAAGPAKPSIERAGKDHVRAKNHMVALSDAVAQASDREKGWCQGHIQGQPQFSPALVPVMRSDRCAGCRCFMRFFWNQIGVGRLSVHQA